MSMTRLLVKQIYRAMKICVASLLGTMVASHGALAVTITQSKNSVERGKNNAAHSLPNYEVIHSLSGPDGNRMYGPLVADSSGNLFGVAYSGGSDNAGTVFELSPPPTGQTTWTVKVLHSFSVSDGIAPNAGLLLVAGSLYGMTSGSNGNVNAGNVFKLSPPPTGQTAWSFSVLHTFSGPNGDYPGSTLAMDPTGALYGTTTTGGAHGLGIVFKLSPPTSEEDKWTETVLHSFSGGVDGEHPQSNTGLVIDSSGNVYGTTGSGGKSNAGIAFELSPPVGCGLWTEKILITFSSPSYSLTRVSKSSQSFYGVSTTGGSSSNCSGGCGTLFELAPPASGNGSWVETTLYSFSGTNGSSPTGITVNANGDLYGTTFGGGTTDTGVVFKLTPPSTSKAPWIESVLHSMGGGGDAAYPNDIPVVGKNGNYYGDSIFGGSSNVGAIFEFTP